MNNCHARIVLKLNDMQNYALKFSPEIQKKYQTLTTEQ